MKVAIAILSFVLLNYVTAETKTYPRGCIYVLGKCFKECEVGTHAYTTGCGVLTPEPSCDNPTPKPDEKGHICDFSACYCDPLTVRDTTTKKCVKLEDCPKKEEAGDKKEEKKEDEKVKEEGKVKDEEKVKKEEKPKKD